MAAYYNEFDPYAAEWLRELIRAGLIPPGDVDTRSIRDVSADDVRGYHAAHFFAGVAGWPYALRLAGWPDDRPIWSGSAPCQPFSAAGKRQGEADERHLWPEFFRLIAECRPVAVFGEQVAGRDGLRWLDGVWDDCERIGYAFGAANIPAGGVGAPHRRERLFWVADAGQVERGRRAGECRPDGYAAAEWDQEATEHQRRGPFGTVADAERSGVRSGGPGADGGAAAGVPGADGERQRVRADAGAGGCGGVAQGHATGDGRGQDERPEPRTAGGRQGTRHAARPSLFDGVGIAVGDTEHGGRCRRGADRNGPGSIVPSGYWSDYLIVHCRDGKARRVSPQPGDEPLAHGVPVRRADPRLGYLLARLAELGTDPKAARRILREARRNRVGRLRGYGNAISPPVAAEFVRAYMAVADC